MRIFYHYSSCPIFRIPFCSSRGFISLTLSVIITFVILAIVVSLSSSTLLTRQNVADFNQKNFSYYLAWSCLEHARLKLAENKNYLGNQIIKIGSYQCILQTITTSGFNKIIRATGQSAGATTNLRLTVNSANLSTVSVEELIFF